MKRVSRYKSTEFITQKVLQKRWKSLENRSDSPADRQISSLVDSHAEPPTRDSGSPFSISARHAIRLAVLAWRGRRGRLRRH